MQTLEKLYFYKKKVAIPLRACQESVYVGQTWMLISYNVHMGTFRLQIGVYRNIKLLHYTIFYLNSENVLFKYELVYLGAYF